MSEIKSLIESYAKKSLPHLKSFLQNKKVLDVGCGNGYFSYLYHTKYNCDLTLTDVVDIRMDEAKQFPFYLTSLDALSFDKQFDVVLCQFVLHHLKPEVSLDAITKLLKFGTVLVIIEELVNEQTDLAKAKKFDHDVNATLHPGIEMPTYKYYTHEEIMDLFKECAVDSTLLDKGSEENGFLETRIYFIS